MVWTKEDASRWQREYRLRNREHVNLADRNRWRTHRRYLRRSKTLQDARCPFCEVSLASRSVSMKHRRFCQDCKKDPIVRRYMRNFYMRRWRQKKLGLPQEEFTVTPGFYAMASRRTPIRGWPLSLPFISYLSILLWRFCIFKDLLSGHECPSWRTSMTA